MIRVRRFAVVLIVLALSFSSVAYAEERSAKDYMAEGIRAAYDNMHLVYQAYYDDEGNLEEQPGGLVAIEQEWDGNQLISRTYLGSDGQPVENSDGYAKAVYNTDEDGKRVLTFYDTNGQLESGPHVFILEDATAENDGWSKWLKPRYDVENSTFLIGHADLGEKEAGGKYKCSIEIEFRDVTVTDGLEAFNFRTQGATDGQWVGANVWNVSLMSLDEPIENGTKECQAIVELNETGVDMKLFELGFRCDYWASGEFRVRNVKVERIETK